MIYTRKTLDVVSGLILVAALVQCYASRTQSGCTPLSYPPTMTECRALAKDYNRTDTKALLATGLPVVVHYRCVEIP